MNVDQMPAGRETDLLVMEKVMGRIPCDEWIPVSHPETGWLKNCRCQACYPADDPAYYSTDTAAAFQVVDNLLDGTRTFSLACWSLENDHWQAIFTGKLNMEATRYEQFDDAFAETRPLAICRAALKVMARVTGCSQ